MKIFYEILKKQKKNRFKIKLIIFNLLKKYRNKNSEK
jgi:hypothetical protein